MKVRKFVDRRLAEPGSVPANVRASHHALLAIIDQIPKDAEEDETWSWITGAEAAVVSAVLGYDETSSAKRLTDALLAALAVAWSDHPDFDPRWPKLLPA